MCWNYQVSFSFSVLFLVINSYYLFKKPPYWKEYLLFGTFYFTMELFQTMQWIYGNVYTSPKYSDNSNYGIESCNIINSCYTIIAHILIWSQPVLFNIIGYRTSNNKNIFKHFLLINVFILIYSTVLLNMGFTTDNYYQISNSIFGLSTCTNSGKTGHLVWKFKPQYIDYYPNYLMYLIMCILSFLFYDRQATKIIGYGWLVSIIVTQLLLKPTILEIASSWCLLSIVANVMIFIYLHI